MIASDHDRSFQFTLCYQLVQRESELVAFSVSQPTDTRWQPLKFHALLCQRDPAAQMLILRKQIEYQLIGAGNVRGLAGKRRPAKRPFAFAEQWPDIRRHKSGKVVGVLQSLLIREVPNVVAVVNLPRTQLL